MAKKKEKKYVSDNAQLMAEWDWDKNTDIFPYQVTQSSHKKAWWKCSEGHAWIAAVSLRQRSGCPYCSGRIAIEGENDLQTLYPYLAKQWHYEKNFPLLPSQVKPQSNKKVWWICEKGHKYEAYIQNRTRRGNSCPYCSNHKVLVGFNDLNTVNPKLASEWHPYKNGNLTPSMVTSSGDTVVWWQCSVCGHDWKTSLNSKRGCPRCSAKRMTSFPEQAIFFYVSNIYLDAINRYKYNNYELDIFIPSINTAIEYDGSFYHRSQRAQEKDNTKDELCKKDGIRLIRLRDPALPTTHHAEIIKCLDVYRFDELEKALIKLFKLLGTDVIPNISLIRDWKKIEERNRYYYREKSLNELFPEIVRQWNYEKNGILEPCNFTPGSGRKVWWICDKGHEWEASINSRTRGIGCPYCSGRKVVTGTNDLLTLKPDIAAEWNYEKNAPATPNQVTAYSNKRVWWKCSCCGAEWQSTVANRKSTLCRKCSYKTAGNKLHQQAVAANNLKICFPQIASQWNFAKNYPFLPDNFSSGSGKLVWWICDKGHEWQSTIGNRTKDGLGCPYCGNQKLLRGYNDFATQNPHLINEWHQTKNGTRTPSDYIAGSSKKAWWQCTICGYEWETELRLRNKGAGCPKCAKRNRKKRE